MVRSAVRCVAVQREKGTGRRGRDERGIRKERKSAYERERERVTKEEEEEEVVADLNLSGGPLRA